MIKMYLLGVVIGAIAGVFLTLVILSAFDGWMK